MAQRHCDFMVTQLSALSCCRGPENDISISNAICEARKVLFLGVGSGGAGEGTVRI